MIYLTIQGTHQSPIPVLLSRQGKASMPTDWIDKQFDDLKKLADDRYAPLSEAESKMLRAAIAGDVAWCGPRQKNDDPHNDPSSTEEWGPEREVRAGLLRWLCIDKAAEGYVD